MAGWYHQLNKKMDLKRIIIEAVIGFIIFDLIYLPFILRKMKKGKGKRYMWGIYLSILGVILTSFGVFLTGIGIIYQGWEINVAMIAGIAPFLVVGIPALVVGIFLINHP